MGGARGRRAGPGAARAVACLGFCAMLASLPAAAADSPARAEAPADESPRSAQDGAGFPEALLAGLLLTHTRSVSEVVGVRVDYRALRGDPDWKRLISAVGQSDPDRLRSREAQLAYWINVYNVFAIDLVARDYPLESIRDLGGFLTSVWKLDAGKIQGESYSLDRIEHEILRPMGDPRIHAAIVCASVSCPPLRRAPFDAARLDRQLDETTREFLANDRKGFRLNRGQGVVQLSRIFSWFEDDFEVSGGVLEFVAAHVAEAAASWLREHRDSIEIEYLDYDWRLND